MLFSPVYTEAHPRRNPAQGDSSKSFNSFTFNSLRTLLHNGAPQPPCFQTLPDSFHCNGGVYPPLVYPERSPRRASFSSSAHPLLMFQEINQMRDIRPILEPWISLLTSRQLIPSGVEGSRVAGHRFSLPRTIAPKTPRCQNALERSS